MTKQVEGEETVVRETSCVHVQGNGVRAGQRGEGCWWAVLLQAPRAPSEGERRIPVPKCCCHQPSSSELLLQGLVPALALCLVL